MRCSGKKEGVVVLLGVFLLLFSLIVSAHEESLQKKTLDETLKNYSVLMVLISTVILTVLVLIAVFNKKPKKKQKTIVFVLIATTILITTFFVAGSTIYLNVISVTKGPVHWHADFELWACGEKLDIINPKGLENKVGTPVLHEHNDDRVHVEGVLIDFKDASLHYFFEVIGGNLEKGTLVVPTTEGVQKFTDGQLCEGIPSKVQVFLYRIENPEDKGNWKFTQEKLVDFESYVLAPHAYVPPADCFVVEFGPEKASTDKMCETYEIAMRKGEMNGG